jgi:hypothetical protein
MRAHSSGRSLQHVMRAHSSGAVWRKTRDVICDLQSALPWDVVLWCKTYPCQNSCEISHLHCLNIFFPRISKSHNNFFSSYRFVCWSNWSRGLRLRPAGTRLFRLWVQFQLIAWMSVCSECCVLYRERSLRRADHSFRGVLPNVVRRCVWSKNFFN